MGHAVVILTGFLLSAFTGRIQSASVVWVVGTSPVKYGSTMQLNCTISGVSSCCSGQDREWKRGSTNELLLRNGVPTPAAGTRFREYLLQNQNQMNLLISNFTHFDYDMDYSCGYGFDDDRHLLSKDPSAEYHPSSTDQLIVQVETIVKDLVNYKISAPKVFIPKIAPFPKAKAEFGDILLPVSNITEYDGAVFYNLTLTINADFNCPKDALKITVTAGTYTFDVYNQDICLCTSCAGSKLLCSSISAIITQICIVIVLLIKIYKEEEKKGKKVSFEKLIKDLWTGRQVRLSHTILILVILLVNTLLPGLVGYFICTCLGKTNWFWIICGVGTSLLGVLLAKFLLHVSDLKDLLLFQLILFLVHTIVGILVGILVVLLCIKSEVREPHDRQAADNVALSEGTRSSNSGLFSWASCKVDQEPVNPSKNSAPPKGKTTKTPTNEKDKKQVAVVKPEVNTKHIKTENREKETSFADDKDFESNLNKVPKGRLLPLLNDTATPRALPPKPDTLPPIAGRKLPELNDLDETAPEKKKKKKKKKMQDDDEL